MKLEPEQVAVVTGAASGLGFALAHAFAEREMAVVLADVEPGPLGDAVAAMEADGVPVLGVRTDVRFQEQVDALAAATLERFGRVDMICNNAGVFTMSGPTWEAPSEDWDWVLAVNLHGVVHGIRAFVPHLVAQNAGHVVNTASAAGLATAPGMGPYTVSKHGVVALSHVLRDELADAAPNVGVTVVCPGLFASNILHAERNRAAGSDRLAGTDDATAPSRSQEMSALRVGHEMMAPADAAAIVIAAVEANQLHALPNVQSDHVRVWVDRILADLPDD